MCEAPTQFQPLSQFEISASREQKAQIRELAIRKEAVVTALIEDHRDLAHSYIEAVDKDMNNDTRSNSSEIMTDFFPKVGNNPFSSPEEMALYIWNFREFIRDKT